MQHAAWVRMQGPRQRLGIPMDHDSDTVSAQHWLSMRTYRSAPERSGSLEAPLSRGLQCKHAAQSNNQERAYTEA